MLSDEKRFNTVLRNIFDKFDTDKSGLIEYSELFNMIVNLSEHFHTS